MIALVAFSAAGILLQILGLLIIWNERFYLLAAFVLTQLMASTTNMIHGFFVSSFIGLTIFCLSIWFFFDLHLLRQELKHLELLEERSKSYWIKRLQKPRVSFVSQPIEID